MRTRRTSCARAELEQQVQRDKARRQLNDLQQFQKVCSFFLFSFFFWEAAEAEHMKETVPTTYYTHIYIIV